MIRLSQGYRPVEFWWGVMAAAQDLPPLIGNAKTKVLLNGVLANRGGFDLVGNTDLVIPRAGWYSADLMLTAERGNLAGNNRSHIDGVLTINGGPQAGSNCYAGTVTANGARNITGTRTVTIFCERGDILALEATTATPSSTTLHASLIARGSSLKVRRMEAA